MSIEQLKQIATGPGLYMLVHVCIDSLSAEWLCMCRSSALQVKWLHQASSPLSSEMPLKRVNIYVIINYFTMTILLPFYKSPVNRLFRRLQKDALSPKIC